MATIYKKFGQKVRKLRKQLGLSQEKLAELARIDPKSIVEIESGKRNPTLKTIRKIASALKTKPSKFLS
ncbi:transcriptional regulator [Candidatus Beckwithbacteria bacterium CG10_big_fil_rev_8_21_14_0_10_34_10]|uniref:Transcriptional regulator n=1 Tax=Candidatus Beckwithbacteria bacterium CG10_big_fil_rev_8_21_14_0_10_34_10 TaxID=1974495 RepID=A0A2H0WBF1_9BACT|nr:MAG: transcriptional regulator [Candidatus Beckwithbacteria bacterium CG10_big_fil_rev_8_21_14_0_10_34_10]